MPEYAKQLGSTLHNQGALDLKIGRTAEARKKFEEAIVWQRKALATNPQNPIFRQFLTNHLNALAITCDDLNDPTGAADARRQLADLRANDSQLAALDARLKAIAADEAAKDKAKLAKLPDAERGAWEAHWAEVDGLLEKAGESP